MPNTKDYEQLTRELLVLAQKGDAKSQYHLGVLYNDGKGVEKDYGQAVSWYLKAAQQGHQKAQLYLGLLYQYGRGVQRDYRQAAQWFMKSAEQGEQKAQYFLGVLYYSGETPLHYAASYNKNPESIRFLISQGLDMNAEASTGIMANGTPLSCAVSNGNAEAVRELLKAGANPH